MATPKPAQGNAKRMTSSNDTMSPIELFSKIPDYWQCEHAGSLSLSQQSEIEQALAQIAVDSSKNENLAQYRREMNHSNYKKLEQASLENFTLETKQID